MLRPNIRSFNIPECAEFMQFPWRVDNVQGPCVVIPGASMADRSTFYGSPPGEALVLRREEIAKLPHDLVHMLYSLEAEARVPDSHLTPDIIYRRPDGELNVLEITTRRSINYRTVQMAVEEKISKYSKLLDDRKIQALNVLVVTPTSCTIAYGNLSAWANRQLLQAYRYGRMIQEAFWKIHGNDDDQADENSDRLKDLLGKFEYSDPRFDVRMAPDPAGMIHIRTATYKKSFKTFQQYIDSAPDGVERRTACHLPMILVNEGQFSSVEFAGDYPDHPMADLWLKGLADTDLKSEKDFKWLQARSEMNDGEKQKVTKDLLPDEFRLDLAPDQRAYLSLRGVMAKEIKSDALKAKRNEDKLPISLKADFVEIDDYLASSIGKLGESDWMESSLLDFMNDTGGPKGLIDPFKKLMRTPIMNRCRVLEMIAFEAVANCTRNPKDRGDSRNFIIRPLVGLKAAVMIRTTRGSDLEGKIFCSVLWDGPDDFFEGVFERCHQWSPGKWFTEFFTISREEASQLQGLPSRMLGTWAYLTETFTQTELSPYTTADDFYGCYKELLWIVLIFLSDKQETSELLMSLRYYYMHLLTGTSEAIPEAQKVTNKWPEVIRNPVTAYIIQKLNIAHAGIRLENIKVLRTQDKVSSSEEEEEQLDEGPTIPMTDLLQDGIISFTGQSVKTATQLMHYCYLGNLKNKDKGSSVAGIMKILNKSAKLGQRYVDKFGWKSKHSDHMKLFSDPACIQDFEHSGSSIALGADLMKKRLTKIHSINDWDKYVERELIGFCLDTMISDLCTNKASTIAFDEDMTISIDTVAQDLNGFGVRRRVYDALYRMRNQFKDPRAALNLDQFRWEMDTKEGKKLQVTMFKKNQIGGVREIYVLTFTGRALVRIFSDFYRKIASLHPSEKLTNEQSRDYFVAEHMKEVRERHRGKFKKHLNISADMTSWAQMFTMYEFETMNLCLLPKSMQAFGTYVLSLERDKVLQMPREAVNAFCSSFIRMSKGEAVKLSSDGSEMLRKQFLGMEQGLVTKPFSPYFRLQNDMMMGILHYPSTVYHLLQMEVLESVINTWAVTRGLSATINFQVSSDDEGIMITLAGDDPKLVAWRQKQLLEEYPHIKASIDRLFGISTSFEKTSISIQPIFEFNSKFNLGQTIVSPLIKFVIRSMDDNPADTLHKRVSGLYTNVKAVRENGGTGYLCHFLMLCQAVMYCTNLGLGRTAWATPDIFQDLWRERVSYTGFYQIQNAFTAGVMGLNYSNWISSVTDPNALKLCFVLGSYAIPDDMDALDSIMFGIANTKKYKAIIRDLDLDGIKITDLITEDNFESFLRKSKTMEEEMLKVKKIILSPGMATSLGKRTRSDTMRQAVYLLYTAFCREQEGENKKTMHRFRDSILKRNIKPTVESVYPMSSHFEEVRRVVASPYAVAPKDRRQRTRIHWLSSQYTIGDAQKEVKNILRWKWFDLPVRLSQTQLKSYWTELKMSIPWLRVTLRDTIRAPGYPFKNLHQLLSFFEGYSKSAFPQKMIVRGVIGRSLHPVLDLMRDNTSEACSFVTQSIGEVIPAGFYRKVDFGLLLHTMKVEDRCSAWLEILNNTKMSKDNQLTLDLMFRDIQEIGKTVRWDDALAVTTGQPDHDDNLWRLGVSSGGLTLKDYFKQTRYTTIYREPQSRSEDGSFHGDYECYRRINGVPFHVKKEGKRTIITTPVDEFTAGELMGRISGPIYKKNDVGELPDLKMDCIVVYKNSWYIRATSPNGNFYMSLPRGSPQPHHLQLKYGLNDYLELWLSRQKPSGDAWKSYLDLYSSAPGLIKAINTAVDSYYRSNRIKRIFERSGPKVTEDEAELGESDLLQLADDLATVDNPPVIPWVETTDFAEIMDQEESIKEQQQQWLQSRIQEFIDDFGDEFGIDEEPDHDSDQFQENYEERFVAINLLNDMYKSMWAIMQSTRTIPEEMLSYLQKVILYKD